jgi:hypothetical protein
LSIYGAKSRKINAWQEDFSPTQGKSFACRVLGTKSRREMRGKGTSSTAQSVSGMFS